MGWNCDFFTILANILDEFFGVFPVEQQVAGEVRLGDKLTLGDPMQQFCGKR